MGAVMDDLAIAMAWAILGAVAGIVLMALLFIARADDDE